MSTPCCTTQASCQSDECCPPQDYGYAASKLEVWMVADFGATTTAEDNVATLVKNGNPDVVLMVGDTNYGYAYSAAVGAYYGGLYASGRLLPCPGNHDWDIANLADYLSYFDEERYYSRRFGPVEFFMLDSGFNTAYEVVEPDGNTQGTITQPDNLCCGLPVGESGGSVQWQWFVNAVKSSTAKWKIVCLHHPPYSSGNAHWGLSSEVAMWGSTTRLQWEAFSRLGINLVLSGHEHIYERLSVGGVMYVVNGLGGKDITNFGSPVLSTSQVRYRADYGALRLTITPDCIFGRFMSVSNQLIDEFTIE